MEILLENEPRPDSVPEGVRRAVKEFDPQLNIMPNRLWSGHDIKERYVIAQKVNRAVETIDDRIIAIQPDWFPVLIIPDAMNIETRWFVALWENKIQKAYEMGERLYIEQAKQQDQVANAFKDWARDQGYWAFKKQYGEYYFPGVKARDPLARRKALEDKLGRRPRES